MDLRQVPRGVLVGGYRRRRRRRLHGHLHVGRHRRHLGRLHRVLHRVLRRVRRRGLRGRHHVGRPVCDVSDEVEDWEHGKVDSRHPLLL